MATVDKTTGGTAGHPSTRRKPYWVENTVDFSLFDPAANDVVQMLNVPAETLVINAGIEMRDNVNFIVLTHSEIVETQDFGTSYKMKTIGKMLDDKVKLEGLFTIVLYGKSEWNGKEGKATRNFVTNRDGQYPAKSPLGMFDNLYVPNDLGKIVNTMNAYYEGE